CLRLERCRELGEGLPVTADALHRLDLSIADREDRLDLQQRPGERGRLADAAAALQELERVDGEQQTSFAPITVNERLDLLVARATLQPALDRERQHRDRGGGSLGVDRAHTPIELARRRLRAREGAGDPRREVEREDPLVAAE